MLWASRSLRLSYEFLPCCCALLSHTYFIIRVLRALIQLPIPRMSIPPDDNRSLRSLALTRDHIIDQKRLMHTQL